MQIQRILPNNLNINKRTLPKTTFNAQKVVEEDNYVKIPRKKYQRDKVIENILCAILVIESIICIIKTKNYKTPKI